MKNTDNTDLDNVDFLLNVVRQHAEKERSLGGKISKSKGYSNSFMTYGNLYCPVCNDKRKMSVNRLFPYEYEKNM